MALRFACFLLFTPLHLTVFVWDEAKREANLQKHRLDFADAHLVYNNPEKVTFQSERRGEIRSQDIAIVQTMATTLTLVYVQRGEAVRVISLRTASRRERRTYERRHQEQD